MKTPRQNPWYDALDSRPVYSTGAVVGLSLIGLLIAGIVYHLANQQEQQRLRAVFQRQALTLNDLLQQQIGRAVDALQPLRILFLFSEMVERSEFHGAASDLLARNPAIQAIEWVPRVSAAQRGEYETQARRDGLTGFQIIEPRTARVRAEERPEYYPIYYIEPLKGNESLQGWDTLTGPNRAFMERARDTGEITATGKLKIIQDIGKKSGWILILPLYSGLHAPATVEERRTQLRGFIRIVYRIEDLIEQAVGTAATNMLDVVVLDRTVGDSPAVLYQTAQTLSSTASTDFPQSLMEIHRIPVAGREWVILARPNKALMAQQHTYLPALLAAAVLACEGLIILIFIRLLHQNRLIAEEVAERTSTLLITNQLLKEEVEERKQAERASRESEERFRALADSAPVLIWMTEADLTLSYFNRTWLQFRGRELAQEANDGWRSGVHPEDLPMWDKALAEARDKNSSFHLEFRLRRHDGEYRWMFGTGTARLQPDNAFTGFIGTCLDVTPLRQAEAERLKLERKIQEAQKLESLGIVAGGIAHDFNNLLTAVLGHANLARMALSASSPAGEHLAGIEKAALRAAELCKQMLAYAGKGRFAIVRLNLSQLVEDTMQLLQLAISKSAVLKFNLASNLPPVEADPTQMRQVVMNLVINASEAIGTRSGIISISTGLVRVDKAYLAKTQFSPELPEGEYVYLEVSDNGCGMDAETINKIFDPFFTTKFAGRGLGLAAVLGIVRSHRGAIKVYSELGRGSTFKILLPASTGVVEALPALSSASGAFKGSGPILVIDDEETVRAIACRMLEALGFLPVQAEDGRAGLELFKKASQPFRAVLLDLTMPHMDGEATFRELRLLQPDVRVILMSGYNEQEAVGRFVGKGLAGFLQKPFKLSELRDCLKTALESPNSAVSNSKS